MPEMAWVACQGRGLSLIHQTQGREAKQGQQKAKTRWFLVWLEWGFLCSSCGLALHPQLAEYKVPSNISCPIYGARSMYLKSGKCFMYLNLDL